MEQGQPGALYVGSVYILPHEAGKMLGVSAERVRQLCNSGVLSYHETIHGWRVLERADVKELARKRKALEEAKAALRGPVNEPT